jgi:hypothetical protein
MTMAGSITGGDPLDLEYHGDAAYLATAGGVAVRVRRAGTAVWLRLGDGCSVRLTDDEADQLAYELACAALAAMATPEESDQERETNSNS